MTVLTDTPRERDYTGDGSTTVYAFTFLIFAASDLVISQDDVALTLNTHYTVSGVQQFTGGSITFVIPPPNGSSIKIRSDVPIVQGTSFPEGYRFPGRTVEATLDRLTIIARQLKDRLRHTLLSPDTETALDLQLPPRVAGKVWGWNDALTAVENKEQAPIGPIGPEGPQGMPGAGAAPVVREVDGTPSIGSPSAIEFDQADGFVVSNPAPGVARVKLIQSVFTPGMVLPHAGGIAPSGWLLCDGAAVSRTTYAALFAVISTAYGAGNGTTTFNVPDTRSRFVVGAGIGPGLTIRSVGGVGGEETHVLTVGEMPAHTHAIPMVATANTGGNPTPTGGAPTSTVPTQSAGGDGAHNTMPPFIGMTYIVKT